MRADNLHETPIFCPQGSPGFYPSRQNRRGNMFRGSGGRWSVASRSCCTAAAAVITTVSAVLHLDLVMLTLSPRVPATFPPPASSLLPFPERSYLLTLMYFCTVDTITPTTPFVFHTPPCWCCVTHTTQPSLVRSHEFQSAEMTNAALVTPWLARQRHLVTLAVMLMFLRSPAFVPDAASRPFEHSL